MTKILVNLILALAVSAFPAHAVEWVRISGTVSTQNNLPVCAMVLANGQHMFTCNPVGIYDLNVPLDDNEMITLFAFADGFMPFKRVLNKLQTDNDIRLSVCYNKQPIYRAMNQSSQSQCAEDDNINVPIFGADAYTIEAIHPTYTFEDDNCLPNFDNCTSSGTDYPFSPATHTLLDDGITVIQAVTEASWWLPMGMNASVNDDTEASDIHYIRIYKKINGSNEWPQILVLYMDGNLRLIPQPPQEKSSVCFGSSVIVGPADVSDRPVAEITSIRYDSNLDRIEIDYRNGDSAIIEITYYDRTKSIVRVSINQSLPDSDTPLATFRSMYVADGNADVDHIKWLDNSKAWHDESIMDFREGVGTEWFFYRATTSIHNTSAPDIRIAVSR